MDLGDISSLEPKDILKISHILVSHTHMDHFIGFDRLLRIFLGRNKELHLFGPEGIIGNVAGKLAGYSWNLVDSYAAPLVLRVSEIHPRMQYTQYFRCQDRFRPSGDPVEASFDGTLWREDGLILSAVILDHGIPCIGFSIEESFHVNIIKENLSSWGLSVGPWLGHFKEALYRNPTDDSLFDLPETKGTEGIRSVKLRDLAGSIAAITPGQKVAYITDTAYTEKNRDRIVHIARGADHLFIEAAFSEKDCHLASAKYHLTARQAGRLAGEARVGGFTLFHFSPRYRGREAVLQQEAADAFEANSAGLSHIACP